MDAMRMTTEADLNKPDFRKDLAIKIRDAMNTLLESTKTLVALKRFTSPLSSSNKPDRTRISRAPWQITFFQLTSFRPSLKV